MVDKKKILLVSSAFHPEISPRSFRATELAKEFYRQGHDVTVISKFRDYDYSELLAQYPLTLKMWDKPKFPKVPEVNQKPFSIFFRMISRLLSVFLEYPGIEEMYQVRNMLKEEDGYDLMISFAVPFPVHWGVSKAKSYRHSITKIWVSDCGDPFMFQRLDRFRKPFYFKYYEKDFCRKCDYISIPIEGMQNKFYPEFLFKISVIPQGINFKEVRISKETVANEIPTFIFAGSVIPGKRDLSELLDLLTALPDSFLFIVYTNQSEWYGKYKEQLGRKLDIRPYIERLDLIYEMSKADFLINIDTVYDQGSQVEAVPSKLIDYALAERPVLNIVSNYLDRELVLEFLGGDYSRQRTIDKSKFDIRKVATRFLNLS